MMTNKTILEDVIEVRRKYRDIIDRTQFSNKAVYDLQLLGRVVNDLTDIIIAEQQRKSKEGGTHG